MFKVCYMLHVIKKRRIIIRVYKILTKPNKHYLNI